MTVQQRPGPEPFWPPFLWGFGLAMLTWVGLAWLVFGMTLKPDPKSYPPLGMSREDAAHYISVSPTLFDEMVRDRRMPRPKRINSKPVWDQEALRLAFKALPGDEENTLDALFAEGARRRG